MKINNNKKNTQGKYTAATGIFAPNGKIGNASLRNEKKIAWDMSRAIILIMDVIKYKATHERRFRVNNYKNCDVFRHDTKWGPEAMEAQCNFIFQKLFENVDKPSLFHTGEDRRTKHPASRKYVAKLYKKYFGKTVSDNVMNNEKNTDNCFWFIKKMYGEEMKKLEFCDLYGRRKFYPQEFMYFMCRKMMKKLEKLGMKKQKEEFRKQILNICSYLPSLENFRYSLENNWQFPTFDPKDKINNNDFLKESHVYSNDSSDDSEHFEDKMKKNKNSKIKPVNIININNGRVNNKDMLINNKFNKGNRSNQSKNIINKNKNYNNIPQYIEFNNKKYINLKNNRKRNISITSEQDSDTE